MGSFCEMDVIRMMDCSCKRRKSNVIGKGIMIGTAEEKTYLERRHFVLLCNRVDRLGRDGNRSGGVLPHVLADDGVTRFEASAVDGLLFGLS